MRSGEDYSFSGYGESSVNLPDMGVLFQLAPEWEQIALKNSLELLRCLKDA